MKKKMKIPPPIQLSPVLYTYQTSYKVVTTGWARPATVVTELYVHTERGKNGTAEKQDRPWNYIQKRRST